MQRGSDAACLFRRAARSTATASSSRPVRGDEDAMTDVDPTAAAKQARELLERYVGLQPHEARQPQRRALQRRRGRASACDGARARAICKTEADFQCNVSVRHSDPAKLRRVYARAGQQGGRRPRPAGGQRDLRQLHLEAAHFGDSAVGHAWTRRKADSSPLTLRSCMTWFRARRPSEWIPVDWTNERPNLGARALALVLSQRLGRERAQIHHVPDLPVADRLGLGLCRGGGRRRPPDRCACRSPLPARATHLVAARGAGSERSTTPTLWPSGSPPTTNCSTNDSCSTTASPSSATAGRPPTAAT